MDYEKALDKFDGEKPETKASLHKKETQHLWDQVKTIADTRKKNRRR